MSFQGSIHAVSLWAGVAICALCTTAQADDLVAEPAAEAPPAYKISDQIVEGANSYLDVSPYEYRQQQVEAARSGPVMERHPIEIKNITEINVTKEPDDSTVNVGTAVQVDEKTPPVAPSDDKLVDGIEMITPESPVALPAVPAQTRQLVEPPEMQKLSKKQGQVGAAIPPLLLTNERFSDELIMPEPPESALSEMVQELETQPVKSPQPNAVAEIVSSSVVEEIAREAELAEPVIANDTHSSTMAKEASPLARAPIFAPRQNPVAVFPKALKEWDNSEESQVSQLPEIKLPAAPVEAIEPQADESFASKEATPAQEIAPPKIVEWEKMPSEPATQSEEPVEIVLPDVLPEKDDVILPPEKAVSTSLEPAIPQNLAEPTVLTDEIQQALSAPAEIKRHEMGMVQETLQKALSYVDEKIQDDATLVPLKPVEKKTVALVEEKKSSLAHLVEDLKGAEGGAPQAESQALPAKTDASKIKIQSPTMMKHEVIIQPLEGENSNASTTKILHQLKEESRSFSAVPEPEILLPEEDVIEVSATAKEASSIVVEEAEQVEIAEESKKILRDFPSGLDAPKKANSEKIQISRATVPDLELIEPEVKKHEALGISIEVKKPNLDVGDYLTMAYQAMETNQLSLASQYYDAILESYPQNQEAMLGMATVSHKLGDLDYARSLYQKLLMKSPENRDVLNNFLVLVSEESPKKAIEELLLLERKNPHYDVLPAQLATLYAQDKQLDKALLKMGRAVQLSPHNLMYRYNLAVMLDHAGRHDQAIQVYHYVRKAIQKGEKIPADLSYIQERLTFLLSNRSG